MAPLIKCDYIARQHLNTGFISEHCKWGGWGEWSSISSCGTCTELRSRTMIDDGKHGGRRCMGETDRETRLCNPPCCTRYKVKCDMPFKYMGVTYNNCIRDCEEPNDRYGWCPTEKDSNGNGIKWQRCNHDCFLSRKYFQVAKVFFILLV